MRKKAAPKAQGSKLLDRMFARAFVTAAMTEFAQIVALTIDSLIICVYLGENEIAAVGLTSPFFYIVGIPAACLGTGFQIACSREMGRGKIDDLNRVFSQSILFSIMSMALLTAAVFPAVPLLAQAFGARGNTAHLLPLAKSYLYGLAFEIVPFVLQSALIAVVILDNGSKLVMASSIVGGVSNIAFDIMAVHYRWGLFGIGLGSSLSVVLSMATLMLHFLRKDRVLRFRFMRVRWDVIRTVLKSGAPSSVHAAACAVRIIALNMLAAQLGGSVAVAVLAILGTVLDFIEIPTAGVKSAVGILSGIGYGERNGEDLEHILLLAHRYLIVIAAVIMWPMLSNPQWIADGFLGPDSEGMSLLIFAIACVAFNVLFGGQVYARVSYLQAIDRESSGRRLEEAANLVIILALAAVLSWPLGVYGLFLAFPLSKILSLVIVFIKYALYPRIRLPRFRDFMALDPSFYPGPADIVVVRLDDMQSCIRISEAVRDLCMGHGLGRKLAFYASLCAEEIATNIVEHGGRRSGRLFAEIRATVADGELIMRVRDNGRTFNMNALAKLLADQTSPEANLGIRIICAAAREIGYYHIFNINTTVIRVGDAVDTAAQTR